MTINFDPNADEAGEMIRLNQELANTLKERQKALEKWDSEPEAVASETTPPPVVVAAPPKPRWTPKDREFVKKLRDLSMKAAAKANLEGADGLKDLFLAQAAKLEEELKQFPPEPKMLTASNVKITIGGQEIKVFGKFEPIEQKRRRKCKSSNSRKKKSKTSRRS